MARPVGENLIGRVLDAGLLLERMAAAEVHAPTAENAAATDIVILVDNDDGGAVIACRDGGRQSSDTSPDHHHLRRAIPIALRTALGIGFPRAPGGQRDAGRARRQEGSPADLA